MKLINVAEAARIIRSGGVVVIATETFYALAADPFNPHACAKIYEIKGRDDSKPLPLIAPDVNTVMKLIESPTKPERRLMERLWPGSVTLLLAPGISVPAYIMGKDRKVAVRVPPDCPCRELALALDSMVTATSANASGAAPAVAITEIDAGILDAADAVVDTGPTPGGLPSTLVMMLNARPLVIREGAVSAREIFTALNE
jgi:L-threonylcarbamoyladenylate synthase